MLGQTQLGKEWLLRRSQTPEITSLGSELATLKGAPVLGVLVNLAEGSSGGEASYWELPFICAFVYNKR